MKDLKSALESKEAQNERLSKEEDALIRYNLIWKSGSKGTKVKRLLNLDDYRAERVLAGLAPHLRNDIYEDLQALAEFYFKNGKILEGEELLDWGEEHFSYEAGNLRVLRAELYLQTGLLDKCSKLLVEIAGGESKLGDVDWSLWTEHLKDFYTATVMEQSDREKSSINGNDSDLNLETNVKVDAQQPGDKNLVSGKNFFVESSSY